MKKTFILFFIAGSSLFLVQCATKKATTSVMSPAAQAKVDEVKRNFTPVQMEEGKTIWQGNCNKCHKLYAPDSRTVAKWENILPRMTKRAKLNDDHAGKVRAFLLTQARS